MTPIIQSCWWRIISNKTQVIVTAWHSPFMILGINLKIKVNVRRPWILKNLELLAQKNGASIPQEMSDVLQTKMDDYKLLSSNQDIQMFNGIRNLLFLTLHIKPKLYLRYNFLPTSLYIIYCYNMCLYLKTIPQNKLHFAWKNWIHKCSQNIKEHGGLPLIHLFFLCQAVGFENTLLSDLHLVLHVFSKGTSGCCVEHDISQHWFKMP